MAEPIWLGIDVGTQSVRCVAVAGDRVAGAGSAPLAGRRAGNRHEQDPRDWWAALVTACRRALADLPAGLPTGVRAVALCATSGTVLLADRAGRPVSPGLMYDDTRAAGEADRAAAAGAALWRELGYRPQPSWALPKLLWLLDHHGADRPAGVRLRHQSDHLTGLLTGRPTAADSSSALKTGYDLVRERWPGELLAELGVPAEALPEVVRPGSPLGEVCAAAAAETGIPAGTPVRAGMTDGCAALLGSGALTVGSWNAVLGTTLVLKGVTAHRLRDPLGVVYSHRAPGGAWLPGGASGAGAGVLSAEFPGRDLDELGARAAALPPSTMVTYPLVSRGERFPFVAPDAERFTLGEPASEVDAFAAVLRGVAFVERLCFDYLDLLGAPVDGPIRLTGGGTRSRHWCQLRADTLGREVVVPEQAEPAVGMAVLARAGTGSLAEAGRHLVRPHRTFVPRGEPAEALREGYLGLADELHRRGWLPDALARHARERSTA
ncbi:Sugar (pentulose or hexulose) kinase [Amycolatopsis arida]|uniref:Sugar (Pentulose or hexulose) kinase n=1 Tax=Amycolatopsis arida TaxID=587909 RepID=A0A1I5VA41_9PSEU|nr:FGGY family carbohydrate kinase [Amycolatopsis arida]TDX91200.1 sugar (pentulose or hexulose) kinase [Amycolatopsis arida]SFQ04207.1 Sugar (pentulose or hexulose) kinase [Amycolatopsis arida]